MCASASAPIVQQIRTFCSVLPVAISSSLFCFVFVNDHLQLSQVDDAMKENSTSMYLPRSVEFFLGSPWAGTGPQRFFHSWSGLAFGRQQWYFWPPGTHPKSTVDSAVGSSVAAWLASHSTNDAASGVRAHVAAQCRSACRTGLITAYWVATCHSRCCRWCKMLATSYTYPRGGLQLTFCFNPLLALWRRLHRSFSRSGATESDLKL